MYRSECTLSMWLICCGILQMLRWKLQLLGNYLVFLTELMIVFWILCISSVFPNFSTFSSILRKWQEVNCKLLILLSDTVAKCIVQLALCLVNENRKLNNVVTANIICRPTAIICGHVLGWSPAEQGRLIRCWSSDIKDWTGLLSAAQNIQKWGKQITVSGLQASVIRINQYSSLLYQLLKISNLTVLSVTSVLICSMQCCFLRTCWKENIKTYRNISQCLSQTDLSVHGSYLFIMHHLAMWNLHVYMIVMWLQCAGVLWL